MLNNICIQPDRKKQNKKQQQQQQQKKKKKLLSFVRMWKPRPIHRLLVREFSNILWSDLTFDLQET